VPAHWLLIRLLAFGRAASAEEIFGRVVSIQDRDSITELVSRRQIKVRLTEIESPGAPSALLRPRETITRRAMCRRKGHVVANGALPGKR
jgi:hypothetical protein